MILKVLANFKQTTHVGPGCWKESPIDVPEGSRLLRAGSTPISLALGVADALKISAIETVGGVPLSKSAFNNSDEVGVALSISMDVGVPLNISAGALNRCSSAEVGVALERNSEAAALALMRSAGFEGTPLNISVAVGAERNRSAEGVADLIYSEAAVGLPPLL